MTGAWKEPAVEDVKTFMSGVVVDRVNDASQTAKIIPVVVARIRGIVGRANMVSDNPNEVPPEALGHALILVLLTLLTGAPNFQFLMKGPDGSETGFGYNVRMAEKWLTDVKEGMSVTYPVNPVMETPNLVRYGGETFVDTTAA